MLHLLCLPSLELRSYEMSTLNFSKVQNLGAWLLVSLSATGCANTPYADSPQWGLSVRQAIAAQTLNPNAGQTKTAPPDADGAVMKSAVDRYQSSFDKPPAPVNVMNIGLGGSSGTSGR
jgi:hypothetical protein